MRKVREFLRLRFDAKLSGRQVARSLGISSSTASEYGRRAEAAGLGWPVPAEMDDTALERALFGPTPTPAAGRGMPDIVYLKGEMARKHVTLMLLWTEYRESQRDGYGYTQFCEHYQRGVSKLDLVMRQDHRAGEKMFVDWAGDKARWVERETGEVRWASLFLAVLGASSYTYAEATADEQSPNWIRAHVHAWEFFGGVTELTVSDNLRTAVRRPCRYEPDLNPLYVDLAAHYGTAVVPARVLRPRDKAKVEAGVQVAARWILAALRHRKCFSLDELNTAIRELSQRINHRLMRHVRASRHQLYERLDFPALRALPAERYQWIGWKQATVHIDYHIECDHHFYSVPFTLVRERVDVRLSTLVIEVLHKGRRVASHMRSYVPGGHTTCKEHMPSAHRRYGEWTPSRLVDWASQTGPAAAALVQGIMERRPHPEQGFRSCMGLVALGKKHTPQRVEAACQRALDLGTYSYQSVNSMLTTGLERARRPRPSAIPLEAVLHENVRGSAYYEEVK